MKETRKRLPVIKIPYDRSEILRAWKQWVLNCGPNIDYQTAFVQLMQKEGLLPQSGMYFGNEDKKDVW